MSENVDNNGGTHITDTEAKIIRQVEYYFGDFNLARDKFLKDAIKADDGWVSMDTMLKFQRLSQISNDAAVILDSLKKSTSGLMEVDDANKKIRRCPEKPLPEEEGLDKARVKVTAYVKGFEKEKTTLDDLLDFFSKYDNVVNVYKRTWLDKKTKDRNFKGSAFVTFKDRESAEKFMAIESVKNLAGEELIRKWQEDYLEEKRLEVEEKKKKVSAHRAGAKKVKAAVEDNNSQEENQLPKGALLKLDQLNDSTTREMLREKLSQQFGVEHTDIAFIYYNKGEPTATLRFKEKDAAKDLAEKIEKSLVAADGEEKKKFEINNAEATFTVLEGEEETAFLDKCLSDMTTNRGRSGHKRKGGFQRGRGGKRGRR